MPQEDEMTNGGYEQAKANRNVLEKLGEKIPGFRGFQDRELRRDVTWTSGSASTSRPRSAG
jgi:hypothetical protein